MIHVLYGAITLVVFVGAMTGVFLFFRWGLERGARKRSEPPEPESMIDRGNGYFTPSKEFWERLRAENPGLPETPPTRKYEFRLAWKRHAVIVLGFLGVGLARMGFWPEDGDPDWRIGAGGVALFCACVAVAGDYILRAIRDR